MILAFTNFADANTVYTPTLGSGSWSTALPLTNLQDVRLAKVARSSDVQLASTKFEIDLKTARQLRLFSIPKHTLSTAALFRIRISNTAGDFTTPVYDTGWIAVWPVVYPWQSLEWTHPSFWTGRLAPEDAAGYNIGLLHVAATEQRGRYVLFEIDDTTNTDGYIDLSRLFLATGYQPTKNAAFGFQISIETETQRERSLGGVDYFDRREPRRIARMSINNNTVDEVMVNLFEMHRRSGIDGQIMFVFDPDDTVQMHRRSFLANQRSINPIDYPYAGRANATIELQEVL